MMDSGSGRMRPAAVAQTSYLPGLEDLILHQIHDHQLFGAYL